MALVSSDEAELRALAARLTAAGVEHVQIVESDGDHAGQMMAIGIRPGIREGLRPHVSSFALLRGAKTR